jgi:predicted permease
VVFSLGPALSAARTNIAGNLKAHGGEPAGTGALGRFFAPRHLLVMTQMTLSLVLLFSAALFLRGALKAAGLDVGFDPRGVTLAELDFSLTRTPEIEARRRMEGLLAQVAAFPGVQAAGFSSLVPYGNITNSARIMPAAEAAPESLAPDAPRPGKGGIYTAISPGYLEALGVKVLRGRDFSEVEGRDPASAAVCLIDEGMARELFPDADALGQRVRFTQTPRPGVPSEMEVVGIVSRHRHELDDQPSGVPGPARRLYVPHSQHYTPSVFLLVRHDASLGPRALREALARADAELPLLQLTPLADMMERSVMLWTVRLGAVMFGIFGLVALLLAAVGVYGVKAYAVQRRTREIGIRMALGADRGEVFGLIMRQGALQTALSVTLGIGLSLMVGQALAAILFQVSPADPVALGTATMVLTAATLAACIVPARRAMRVDPITSLRDE